MFHVERKISPNSAYYGGQQVRNPLFVSYEYE
jgi:hypothetical protein